MKRISTILSAFCLIGLAFVIGSCGRSPQVFRNDYMQTMQSGLNFLPWPKQMEALFGEGDHFIVHYGSSSGAGPWQTEVFLCGRYTLTLEVNIEIDYNLHALKPVSGPPHFYLNEVASIHDYNGRPGAIFSGQTTLDQEQWKKLVAAKGDWTALGITLKTNSPVIGFDDYVKAVRAPRVKIPH